jgi:FixJ family two-component response regulator
MIVEPHRVSLICWCNVVLEYVLKTALGFLRLTLILERDHVRREKDKALAALRERFGSLSPREREIMIQVARGRLSKQIADDIGIAEATVKVHRSSAMHKMNARSLPELGRMVDQLKLVTEKPQRS